MDTGQYRITVLQSCDEAYAPILEATADANSAYASAHGYSYQKVVGNISRIPHTANFNRYYLLRDEIESGHHDWALWLDADAIVIDDRATLESIIARTPDKMLIACRGSMRGEFDINNGVFLLNLRHTLASQMVESAIRHCESIDPGNATFRSDQYVMHAWLLAQMDEDGRIEISQCYTGRDYNLFNYDGPFIRHVLRQHGPFERRVRELQRLAEEARLNANGRIPVK